MKNIIFLSLLLAIIAGISSCTEKEDPIQTIKDRLVGTWVEKSQNCPQGYCDTIQFTKSNTVKSVNHLNGEFAFYFLGVDSIRIENRFHKLYFSNDNKDLIITNFIVPDIGVGNLDIHLSKN